MTDSNRECLLDRRNFVRAASMFAASVAVGSPALWGQRFAAPGLTIGMILPQARTDSIADAIAGIELGIDEAVRSTALFQKRVMLARKFFISGQDAAPAAINLVVADHATVLIGGGDDDQCRAISNVCVAHGAVFMNVISRSNNLRRSNCTRLGVHIEGSEAMYSSARKLSTEQTSNVSAGCDVALWSSLLERYGASQLNDRFFAKSHRPMTGSSWAGWMAVKVATESFLRVGVNDGKRIVEYMTRDTTQFDGHKGAPLSFRSWDHQLRQPLYCVAREASGSPIVRDVPDVARSSRPARELLDELGDDKSVALCKGVDR